MVPKSEAGVLILDNTSSLTMADGGTQTLDMSNTSKYFGYTFRVKAGGTTAAGEGYLGRLQTIGVCFKANGSSSSGDYTLNVSLYGAGGDDLPTGSALATTSWTIKNVTTTAAYFQLDMGGTANNSGWHINASTGYDKFALTFGVSSTTASSTNLKWKGPDNDGATPADGSSNSFIGHENFIQSTDGGSSWSVKSMNYSNDVPGLYLSNTAAVPEPHEYALMAGLGLIGFGIWRRRMKGATSASA